MTPKQTIQALAEKEYDLHVSKCGSQFRPKECTEHSKWDFSQGFIAGYEVRLDTDPLIEALKKIEDITLDCHTQVEVAQIMEIARTALAAATPYADGKEDWKDAQRNKVQLSNVQYQDGIQLEWLKIWEQIEIWYGDPKKKESGRDFLLRMQSEFPIAASKQEKGTPVWIGRTVMCSWFFVDVNKLGEGIYQSLLPILYTKDDTIEKILNNFRAARKYINITDEAMIEVEKNLKQCRMVDIALSESSETASGEGTEAEAFAEWKENKGWWADTFEEDGTTKRPHMVWSNAIPNQYITTSELYQLYLKSRE